MSCSEAPGAKVEAFGESDSADSGSVVGAEKISADHICASEFRLIRNVFASPASGFVNATESSDGTIVSRGSGEGAGVGCGLGTAVGCWEGRPTRKLW